MSVAAGELSARIPASAARDSGATASRGETARFVLVLAQLASLLYVFYVFNIEGPPFFYLAACCFAGFVIHYTLPARFKQSGFIVISLLSGVVVLTHADPWVFRGPMHYVESAGFLVLLLGFGLLILGVLRLPVRFWVRLGVVLLIGGTAAWLRHRHVLLTEGQWRVLGAIFMFRLILYAYEVKAGRSKEKPGDYLSYFYLLPNFAYSVFPVFPVIDYATFKKCRVINDVLPTAQRGVAWIVRGTIQIGLYRLIYHRIAIGPDDVDSFATLCRYVFPSYLMYVHVSGQFHIITGMLHLFGYRLPETNRRYLLAESFTDFWRRINIYWKDFMVKCFYYPAYFRLRKRNETLALCVATIWVFLATTLLHGYQTFWLTGELRVARKWIISQNDIAFWSALGLVVLITVLRQSRRGRPAPQPPAIAWIKRVLSTLGVYVTISVLWSMWSSTSIPEWIDTVLYWRD
ncbi:MAG: hypothetical protein L6R00_19495 [Phycisphaerae bacterium]|nr:hypothetical protein [Phycisphaerae bacterium]